MADAGAAKRRRLAVIAAGHRGEEAAVREALTDPVASVRAAALGALARCGVLDPVIVAHALEDPVPTVRRRSAELAAVAPPDDALDAALAGALGDADPLVAEAACWAVGERETSTAVPALTAVAAGHPDARCREAAVAALGAIGDPAGLAAILAALDDRPSVRRRATVALAAFEGPVVDDALRRSAADRDWQVREVAEILLGSDAAGALDGADEEPADEESLDVHDRPGAAPPRSPEAGAADAPDRPDGPEAAC